MWYNDATCWIYQDLPTAWMTSYLLLDVTHAESWVTALETVICCLILESVFMNYVST